MNLARRVCVILILLSLSTNLIAQKDKGQLDSLVRPQTPRPPFPYASENVIYSDSLSGISFGATLTYPEKGKTFPAVILVSGTGPQDRDGTMAGHKMFAVIADYLSRQGIAVLRVDDRGVGETGGVYESSTTADFADDVFRAIKFLKTRKEINSQQIGLIGHSEGGAVISMVAAQSKDVAFIISLAGLAMNGLDALLKQNEDIVAAADIPDYDKKRYNEINGLMFQVAYKYADLDSLEQKLNKTYANWKVKDDEYFNSLNVEFDHFRFPIYSYVRQATGSWYRFFIRYNPADYLAKVKVPVLAINGDKDLMVAYQENLDNWKNYPAQAGNNDVITVVMPGLNHLFQHCKTGKQDEYSKLEESFAPEVLKLMTDWILKQTKN